MTQPICHVKNLNNLTIICVYVKEKTQMYDYLLVIKWEEKLKKEYMSCGRCNEIKYCENFIIYDVGIYVPSIVYGTSA